VQQTGGEEKQQQKQKEELTGVTNDATIIQCGAHEFIQRMRSMLLARGGDILAAKKNPHHDFALGVGSYLVQYQVGPT